MARVSKSFPKSASWKNGSGFDPKGYSHRDHRSKKGRKPLWQKNSILAKKEKLNIIQEKELKKEIKYQLTKI